MMRRYLIKPPAADLEALKEKYRKDLNPQQLEVVMAGDGPILVIAGPGSGKTRTITYRMARLTESGISTANIVLLTFTNKAAREMLNRAEALLRADFKKVYGGTFHHVGNIVLRHHCSLLGYAENFSILDREESKELIESCTAELAIDVKARRFPKGDVIGDMISFSVNTQAPFEAVVEGRYPFFAGELDDLQRVKSRYGERKKAINAMDYDDLLLNWRKLLEEYPEINAFYRSKFRYILVDEYQDTNKIQADILDLLAAPEANLMVVGDDAQSIYAFRGANFGNIIDFPKRYPGAKIFRIEINYRSRPEILELANNIIIHNRRQFRKTLRPTKLGGAKPSLCPTNDSGQQAAFVAQRALELRDEGAPLGEMAVLYRAHHHSLDLQVELARRGIPFEVRSGLRFFEQAHIKDVTSYMRIAFNPADELAWRRVMKLYSGIGGKTAEKIWQHLSKQADIIQAATSSKILEILPGRAKNSWPSFAALLNRIARAELSPSPSDMIKAILKWGYEEILEERYPNYASRLDDIVQLSIFALQYPSLEAFLSQIAMLASFSGEEVLFGGDEDEKLILSTIHQAKGLEWRVVFIICLAEGMFPNPRALKEEAGEEEERRLFYVAATRAKDQLYLCYPLTYLYSRDKALLQKPSRFIEELPPDCFEPWEIG